jgi:hypothetical protein
MHHSCLTIPVYFSLSQTLSSHPTFLSHTVPSLWNRACISRMVTLLLIEDDKRNIFFPKNFIISIKKIFIPPNEGPVDHLFKLWEFRKRQKNRILMLERMRERETLSIFQCILSCLLHFRTGQPLKSTYILHFLEGWHQVTAWKLSKLLNEIDFFPFYNAWLKNEDSA